MLKAHSSIIHFVCALFLGVKSHHYFFSQMLVVLNLRGQLCLFSKDSNELRRTVFVLDGYIFDESILYHTHFSNRFGNPEKHFNNSVAVRGATVYILGPNFLTVSRLLPWKERIEALKRAGDWMGALDMAMKLYDGQTQGVVDLPRTVDSIREAIMPYLVELLLSYIHYVFEYISIALSSHTGKGGASDGLVDADRSLLTQREEQYARVGGVAVEFCVHIGRNDILFDTVFSKFVAAKSGGTLVLICSQGLVTFPFGLPLKLYFVHALFLLNTCGS